MVRKILPLLLLLCASSFAQTTYQPTGAHSIYNDGSTYFYYKVVNPSTGNATAVTLEFWCNPADTTATFVSSGDYETIPTVASCLKPGTVGTVTLTTGGTKQDNGMTLTLNPGSFDVYKEWCGRSGCIYGIRNINMPLTVQ